MGTTVLNPGEPIAGGPHLYANCSSDIPGAVVLLAVNNDRGTAKTITVPVTSEQYALTAPQLEGARVDLNGNELTLGVGDSIPQLTGVEVQELLPFRPPVSRFLLFATRTMRVAIDFGERFKTLSSIIGGNELGEIPEFNMPELSGRFQFNIVVPASLAAGDQPIVATYGGASAQPGTLLSVHP